MQENNLFDIIIITVYLREYYWEMTATMSYSIKPRIILAGKKIFSRVKIESFLCLKGLCFAGYPSHFYYK